jgi:hypothetical protein
MRKPEFGKKNPVISGLVTCDPMCITLKHEWKKKLSKLYAQTVFYLVKKGWTRLGTKSEFDKFSAARQILPGAGGEAKFEFSDGRAPTTMPSWRHKSEVVAPAKFWNRKMSEYDRSVYNVSLKAVEEKEHKQIQKFQYQKQNKKNVLALPPPSPLPPYAQVVQRCSYTPYRSSSQPAAARVRGLQRHCVPAARRRGAGHRAAARCMPCPHLVPLSPLFNENELLVMLSCASAARDHSLPPPLPQQQLFQSCKPLLHSSVLWYHRLW